MQDICIFVYHFGIPRDNHTSSSDICSRLSFGSNIFELTDSNIDKHHWASFSGISFTPIWYRFPNPISYIVFFYFLVISSIAFISRSGLHLLISSASSSSIAIAPFSFLKTSFFLVYFFGALVAKSSFESTFLFFFETAILLECISDFRHIIIKCIHMRYKMHKHIRHWVIKCKIYAQKPILLF